MSNPKLFISYSWSNHDHEQLVLQIATELTESGVDVILDKWDLKEGHDAYAFMEKMVTDPEINARRAAIFGQQAKAMLLECSSIPSSKPELARVLR